MKLHVAGIDPALQNTGLVKGYYDVDTGDLYLNSLLLIETSKSTNKQVRRNSDDLARATQIVEGTREFLDGVGRVTIFAEVPVGSQSARGSFSNGICVGTLAALPSVIQVSPTEVKERATGSKHATKREMIDWAYEKWPHLNWYYHRGQLQNKNEHLADACACVWSGIHSPDFKQLVETIKSVH